jgi:mannose-6-phosphate isomerase-like protein (cupin superfamily)
MSTDVIDCEAVLRGFSEFWDPRIAATINDYHIKLAKISGEFVWHSHADTDEAFLVLKGEMRIELRDGSVDLHAGQLYVVPRGVEHKPTADSECHILLFEPAGTVNTGDNASGQFPATTGKQVDRTDDSSRPENA